MSSGTDEYWKNRSPRRTDPATITGIKIVKESETALDVGSYERKYHWQNGVTTLKVDKLGLVCPLIKYDKYNHHEEKFFVVEDFYFDHGNGD